jgi:DDE superfamily endonuclease
MEKNRPETGGWCLLKSAIGRRLSGRGASPFAQAFNESAASWQLRFVNGGIRRVVRIAERLEGSGDLGKRLFDEVAPVVAELAPSATETDSLSLYGQTPSRSRSPKTWPSLLPVRRSRTANLNPRALCLPMPLRLITGAKRAIFLIVDRGPAHIAKKTKAFVESLNGRLRLFYLPPYSPDRNPDELVWKHLKADTVGRMAITDKADFQTKVRASMRQLQNDPEKIRSFYQKPSLKYAAWKCTYLWTD